MSGYLSFQDTSCNEVNKLLEVIERAGLSHHNTIDWDNDRWADYSEPSFNKQIENQAKIIADLISQKDAIIEMINAENSRLLKHASDLESKTVKVSSGDNWIYGFGVIHNDGLYSFKAYKHQCYEVAAELAKNSDYSPEKISIEPVKVKFAENGNVRIWHRNNGDFK